MKSSIPAWVVDYGKPGSTVIMNGREYFALLRVVEAARDILSNELVVGMARQTYAAKPVVERLEDALNAAERLYDIADLL